MRDNSRAPYYYCGKNSWLILKQTNYLEHISIKLYLYFHNFLVKTFISAFTWLSIFTKEQADSIMWLLVREKEKKNSECFEIMRLQ